MFANALLDSQRMERTRRGWATLTSFGLQGIAVSILFVLPLFYTQVLPHLEQVARVVAPVPEPAPMPLTPSNPPSGGGGQIPFTGGPTRPLLMPGRVPITTATGSDLMPPLVPIGPGNPLARNPGGGVFGSTGEGAAPAIPQHPPNAPPRISVMMEGSLLHRVEPPYPPIAKAAGIQGSVLLAAVIGRDGAIENLKVLSGHPILAQAAVQAVREWRYRPYVLNGVPVEVDTQITVNFILAR